MNQKEITQSFILLIIAALSACTSKVDTGAERVFVNGDGDKTMQALEIAFEERLGSRSILSMKINPVYDFLRDDPRFIALLARVGLSYQ